MVRLKNGIDALDLSRARKRVRGGVCLVVVGQSSLDGVAFLVVIVNVNDLPVCALLVRVLLGVVFTRLLQIFVDNFRVDRFLDIGIEEFVQIGQMIAVNSICELFDGVLVRMHCS